MNQLIFTASQCLNELIIIWINTSVNLWCLEKEGGRGCLLEGGDTYFKFWLTRGALIRRAAYSRVGKGGGGGLVRGFTVLFFFPENDCVPALLGMATAYMYLNW